MNAPARTQKQTFASRLFGYDIFLSFALGPQPRGTQSYTSDLARRLRERDFTVFFSEDVVPPGAHLDASLQNALQRSRILVVITNHGTLENPRWVRVEVEEFRKRHPDRPIIPINIGGTLQDPALHEQANTWLHCDDKIWLDETAEAGRDGIVSEAVIDRLAVAPRHIKANKLWDWLRWSVLLLLTTLVLLAAYFAVTANRNAKEANQQRAAAESNAQVARIQKAAAESNLKRAIAGEQAAEQNAVEAEQQRSAAENNAQLAAQNAAEARQEKSKANIERDRAVALRVAGDAQNLLLRAGGEERAYLEALAAKVLSSGTEADSVLLNVVLEKSGLQKIIPVGVPVVAVAFSADGKHLLSGGMDRSVRIWDAQSGKMIGMPLKSNQDNVALHMIYISPDHKRAVSFRADAMSKLYIWDLQTGLQIGSLIEGREGDMPVVAFSPDSKHIAYGGSEGWSFSDKEGVIHLIDAETGKEIGKPLEGMKGAVLSLAFSPDGKAIASGCDDKAVYLWDVRTGKQIGNSFKGHEGWVTALTFSPDGKRLASGGSLSTQTGSTSCTDCAIRVWEVETGKQIGNPFSGHTNGVIKLAFSPDGKYILSGSNDNTSRLWSVEAGREVALPMKGDKIFGSNSMPDVAFSPDGKYFALASDSSLRVWSMDLISMVPFIGNEKEVRKVGKSVFGNRIGMFFDGALRIWNKETEKFIGVPLVQDPTWKEDFRLLGMAISNDGRYVAAGGVSFDLEKMTFANNALSLWNAQTGQLINLPFRGHESIVRSIAFSFDGTRIVSGGGALASSGMCLDCSIRVWNAQTGQQIGSPMKGHEGAVISVAFSADGGRIISVGEDKSIRIWDAHTGQLIGQPLPADLRSAAFSPDGKYIVCDGVPGNTETWINGQKIEPPDEDTWRLWPGPATWPELLCKKLTRNMSHREWREWVSPDIPYRIQCPNLPIPPDAPVVKP